MVASQGLGFGTSEQNPAWSPFFFPQFPCCDVLGIEHGRLNTKQNPLIPFDWVITANTTSDTSQICPRSSLVLGTFAAINVIAATLNLILGSDRVVSKLSCGLLGKPDSGGWRYMWVVSLGLQLESNALIAMVVKNTPGFLNTFDVGDLVLFLTTRPRLNWAFLVIGHFLCESPFSTVKADGKRTNWWSAATSAAVAEIILQLIGFYTMGRTAAFATGRGYYKEWTTEYRALPSSAKLMYGGAMYYLTFGAVAMFCCFVVLVNLIAQGFFHYFMPKYDRDPEDVKGREGTNMLQFLLLDGSFVCTFIASWLYWAGFVQLAGKKCVSSLLHKALIFKS